MADYGTMTAARRLASFTPDEQATEDDYERSPAVQQELAAAIASERDPAKRRILLDHQASMGGAPPVRAAAPQMSLASFLDSGAPAAVPGASRASSLSDFLDNVPAAKPTPSSSGFIRRALGDSAVSLARGIVEVPQALTGVADLATNGYAGKAQEALGVRYKDALDAIGDYYSPEQKAANAEMQNAKGFIPTISAMLRNPSTIYHQALESGLTMLPGGGMARATMWATLSGAEKAAVLAMPAAERAGAVASMSKVGPVAAGAVGEGATAAGQNAEQVREEDPNGTLTPGQSAILAASGVLTGGISRVVGAGAEKLGIGHLPTMLAQGRMGTATAEGAATGAAKGVVRRAGEGAATGGAQELTQSYQEQVGQNLAQGKPWDLGAAEAGAQGMMAGAALEAGPAVFSGGHAATDPRALKLPETGPMSKAVNAGLDAEGARQDANLPPLPNSAPPAPPEPAPPTYQPLPLNPADEQALLQHANQRAAELEQKAKGTKDESIPGPEGEGKLTIAGTPAQFLKPDEKAELDFLKNHGGNAEALHQIYERPAPDAAAKALRDAERPPVPQVEPAKDGDILNPRNEPFLTMRAAMSALAAAGEGTHDVVRVEGGLAVRPRPTPETKAEPTNEKPPHQPGDILTAQGVPFKNKTAAIRAQKALEDPAAHALEAVPGGYVLRPVATQGQSASGDAGTPAAPAPAVAATVPGDKPVAAKADSAGNGDAGAAVGSAQPSKPAAAPATGGKDAALIAAPAHPDALPITTPLGRAAQTNTTPPAPEGIADKPGPAKPEAAQDRALAPVDALTLDHARTTALSGKTVEIKVQVGDTGKTATMKMDAAEAVRDIQKRNADAEQLLKCLG